MSYKRLDINSHYHRFSSERGQSLVELAIVLPVLILLFLGLIELGMAMRSYLIVVNANREAARFAARGIFADQQIASQAIYAMTDQLSASVQGASANTAIIITTFKIDSRARPGAVPYPTPMITAPYNWDSVRVYTTGTVTHTSQINTIEFLLDLRQQNDQFNNGLIAAHPDAVRSEHNVVIVETYYYHPQFLHAPILEWVFPDPIVLYSRTMQRIGEPRVY